MLNTLLLELEKHFKTSPKLASKINLAKKELINLLHKDKNFLEKEKYYLAQSILMKN